jgi:hypothetical protein
MSGQTHKKPKDLSACDREERGRGGEGVVWMCESVAYGLGGHRQVRAVSDVIYT